MRSWLGNSLALTLTLFAACGPAEAESPNPLHQRIDALFEGELAADSASDAEFVRRIHLDFAGELPTATQVRSFLDNPAPDKRTILLDDLLASPRYASHMADQFSVMLMERRGENAKWREWIESSFAANKPWDQMAREILRADHRNEPSRGAAFFYSKRLEKYGQNPTDFPGLTRDVGRLFLGLDLKCAECHNHRTVDSYKQADFQGLYAAFQNLKLHQSEFPAVEEGVMEGPLEYSSVFNSRKRTTGPRIPGLAEISVQTFEKKEGWEQAPDKKAKLPGIPKFSALAHFAEQLPESPTFAPNIANRLWFLLIGEGIVEPLDLHHAENAPSHPELLNLLSTAFSESGYDIRSFLREIALTRVYQRSGLLPDSATIPPNQKLAVAVERPLSAEQLFQAVLTATGHSRKSVGDEKFEALKKKFFDAFSGEPKRPTLSFSPSLKGILLLLNDEEVAALFSPTDNNLAAKLTNSSSDAEVTAQLFLNVFSRPPTAVEQRETLDYLRENAPTRAQAISDLLWAMITSTEFATNH